MNNIAFMQGRLVSQVDNLIQSFPENEWKKELEIAHQNDLKFIELTADIWNIKKNPIFQKEMINSLKKLFKRNQLECIACTADYFMQAPPWKSTDKNMCDIIERNIINLSQLNGKILVIPLVDHSSIKNKDEEDYIINYFHNFDNTLSKYNIKIAFESDYNEEKLSRFIENFSNNYGINYDIGNSASLGYSPTLEFSSYGNKIIHVHIKDRVLNGETVPLGMGHVNFEEVSIQLQKINYSGNYTLQTARAINEDHVGEIKKNKLFFEKYINLI